MNILSHDYDIIVLTETWFHPGINNNEFIDTRYNVYRNDRNLAASNKSDGGGVLVATLKTLRATLGLAVTLLTAPLTLPPTIDHVLLHLQVGDFCFILSAIYMPPRTPNDAYNTYFNFIHDYLQITNINNFCLIGDFNLPTFEWHTSGARMEPLPGGNQIPPNCYLSNFMNFYNYTQLNTFKNSMNRLLDLCVTNINNCNAYSAPISLVPIDDKHPAFYILISKDNITSKSIPRKTQTKICFREADYVSINGDILQLDWNKLFENKSAEDCVNVFYENLYKIIRNHTPIKNITNTHFPAWFTSSLKHIFRNKNNAWVKWKKYRNQSDYTIFSMFRDRFKTESRAAYTRYINRVEDGIIDNTKYFWAYINNRKSQLDVPAAVYYNDIKADEPEDVCNVFSTYFKSVFQPSILTDNYSIDQIQNLDINTETANIISDIYISLDSLLMELKNLDLTKGPGLDSIPPLFFRSTSASICKPLHVLFNKCLSEGICPTQWKAARIIPIHKGGAKADVANFRPISISNVLVKIFERLIRDHLYPFLHSSVMPQQHGFVRGRSTVTNLMVYTNDLFRNMDDNEQTDSVYTDFSKAFDVVDHKILLDKIAFNGIRGNLWRWFKSYVTNRTQKVVINGYESETVTVTSGVPQGSILGPLLFILFINDIKNCFKHSHFLCYADDLKIYRKINNLSDHQLFQKDLDRLANYCDDNKLKLNINKCKCITFTKKKKVTKFNYTLSGTILDRVETIRDLGVILDTKLTLDAHIDTICNRAFKMFGFVIRASNDFKRPTTYLHLFRSLIRSQLEYAVAIWDPLYHTYCDAIEKVQKKFLRCMHYKCYHSISSYENLLKIYNLPSLKSRRLALQAILLYDFCNNKYDCIDISSNISFRVPARPRMRACRSLPLFATPRCRTNAGERAPLYRLVDIHNKHFNDIDIFSIRIGAFKRMIKDRIQDSYK